MPKFFLYAIGAFLVAASVSADEIDYCDCKKIQKEDAARYDQLLRLDPYTRAGATAAHAPWGLPENPPDAAILAPQS